MVLTPEDVIFLHGSWTKLPDTAVSIAVNESLGPLHLLGSSLHPMLLALVGINTVCTIVHYCQEFGMGLAAAGRMRASTTV